ncbi:63fe7a79-58ed-46ca-ba44-4539a5c2db37 [Sclerotinia trifoliorum]|uniref:63fe7a79-58ed-46ca-ba44-4539a5c2db37 n=1 Tax=Sclerotinia trifoliorum TaxID=28548 RepID=A0A8H2ZS97_9HELO|nr:63fe7a79-58ed-46ca-ba44-4539a5c2db37 [Sclerotinia trifoliorum]
MPPFFSPRKPKAPVRIDTEHRIANSHYYTAFKVVLKITVIALVICIAFLPSVALRNKHRQHLGEHVVKDLEDPTNFDISTELERQVTHVPIRFVKTAKLLFQQLRIRESTSDESTNPSASEQVERSEHVTDDTVDGIQYGDYTLGGSTHQAKSEIERLQHCSAEIKGRNGGRCPTRPIFPTRDDDRVISGRCSWQERRKYGGKCGPRKWRLTSRSLIVNEDYAPPSAEPRDNKHFDQPRSTSSTSTRKPTPTLQVINTCSYESAVENGGRCPHGLVNGQKPAENKPISISIKTDPREPNTAQQPREAAVSEENKVNYKPYQADVCKPRWVRTTDGWCVYRSSFGPDDDKPDFYPPMSKTLVSTKQRRHEATVNEEAKLEPRPYPADSCPELWVRSNGWCYYRGSSSRPLGFWGPESRELVSSGQKRRDVAASDKRGGMTAADPNDSFRWLVSVEDICVPRSVFSADEDEPGYYSGVHSPFYSEIHSPKSMRSELPEQCIGIAFPAEARWCPSPWYHDDEDNWCFYVWQDSEDTSKRSFPEPLGPELQPRGGAVNGEVKGMDGDYPANLCPSPWTYVDGRCIFDWQDDEPLEVSFSSPSSPQRQPRGGIRGQKTQVTSVLTSARTSSPAFNSTSTSTSISATTTIVIALPTAGACDPPWIRTMDGRCFFDPKYQREHPQAPLSRPRKPIRQRRGEIPTEERGVAPSWQAESCELPWIHTSDGWCIYRPDYQHGTQNSLASASAQFNTTNQLNSTAQPTVTEKATATEQATVTGQSTASEQATVTEQSNSPAQPSITDRPIDIKIFHCINDLQGNLKCGKFLQEDTKFSSVHNRRGFWPDDWVPQIEDDCDRFLGNTYMHYQCLQSVKHKNIGLKLIMVFLILAGFGSLVFLIITCVNRAARPKAQPFRQVSGIIDAHGMTEHPTSMCGHYPWNGPANSKPMAGERWTRSPPAYDPMRQLTPDHSGSLGTCSRGRNCASGSSGSNGTENWIRKLCNRCFKSQSHSSLSEHSQMVGGLGSGILRLRSDDHRIDTLKLPNANLATVRRTNGLVLSEENGHTNASADTVVVGSDFGRAEGKGSGSAVGLHEGSSGSCSGVTGGGGIGLTQHGNLSGDTVIEPEAAVIKYANGNGNLKMGCLKTGHLKKVGFEGLEGLEEVRGWRDVDRVEPLRLEKENLKGKGGGCGMGGELEEIQEESESKRN